MENPIDNIIIGLVEKTDGVYKSLKMNPNHLTAISFIFGLMTAYYIYHGQDKLAAVTLFLSYYYDCMDGHYARKYNMVTEFGDYFDHFSDWTKTGVILFAMYKRNPNKFTYIFPVLLIFFILSSIHIGCQENVFKSATNQPFLNNFKLLCPKNDFIYCTRWFGTGTLLLVTLIIILTQD
jgi:phosphatidylglycerophosphate synthase